MNTYHLAINHNAQYDRGKAVNRETVEGHVQYVQYNSYDHHMRIRVLSTNIRVFYACILYYTYETNQFVNLS